MATATPTLVGEAADDKAARYQNASYQVHPSANAVIGFAGDGAQSLALPGMMTAGAIQDLTHTFAAHGVPAEPNQSVKELIDNLAGAAITAFSLLP